MQLVKLTLKLDCLTVSTKTSAGLVYNRTVPSQYDSADDTIRAILKVLSDKYPNIRVCYRDCVKEITYKINIHKSAPPEDKYKGLPASNRYIPDKLITFEARGKRYKIDAKGNIYTEDNSKYFERIKRSKLRYIFNEHNAKRIDSDEFVYKFNKILDEYR